MMMAAADTPAWVERARSAARRVAASAAAANNSAAAAAAPAVTLTLLSWNLQLLSVSVGTPAQLVARAQRIAAKLLSLSADVICLQEVWDAAARAALLAALAPQYCHVYCPADGARCGLLIATKAGFELQCAAFHRFAGARGAESWLFDKGAAGVVVTLRDARVEGGGAPAGARGGADSDSDSAKTGDASRRACLVLVNTHTQSDYWAPGGRARAAQYIELRAFLGRMCGAADVAGLAVRGALLCGDLNCAAGSAEAAAALATLRAPHTVDLAEPHAAGDSADDATFPLGVWARKTGSYARTVPTARLDYVLDASAAARADRQPLRSAAVRVERAIAEDDDDLHQNSFGLLADHAALLAAVALPA